MTPIPMVYGTGISLAAIVVQRNGFLTTLSAIFGQDASCKKVTSDRGRAAEGYIIIIVSVAKRLLNVKVKCTPNHSKVLSGKICLKLRFFCNYDLYLRAVIAI